MAWTAPRTWLVSEMATAALLNQELRDNELFLYSRPYCRIANNAAQSLGTGGETNLTFPTSNIDVGGGGMHTSDPRITIVIDGFWVSGLSVGFSSSATGYRYARLGGLNFAAINQLGVHGGGNDLRLEFSHISFQQAGTGQFCYAAHGAGVAISTQPAVSQWAGWVGGLV